ncbi:CTP synthase [Cardiosporidium cionae]|uniref:CTP synthase n=1 Tax=Cardiosporidium cionae TaxID=476202 RepID=A0ABQ7J964_9APIC|nr:CTP synthase [Cardiosporidium cionae]|eukprot:KAF8820503.1 CTP synthase [Cardiosporidium cionae]
MQYHERTNGHRTDEQFGKKKASQSCSHPIKYIVITGGTISGVGKGVSVCGLGSVLASFNLKVTAIKIDPYLNRDAGTMSPYEHGEVFVLEDGGEVDLDLGNYERSFGATLTSRHNVTTGKIFNLVFNEERGGEYLGETVQMVPHVTDAVQRWISEVSRIPIDDSSSHPDVCLIEVGGTVGDIESAIYLEAIQQFAMTVGRENFCLCHVAYVPVIGRMEEQKTKPTQHSTKELCRVGLKPDFILCRCKNALVESARRKISIFTQVEFEKVISLHDVDSMYEVPLLMDKQHLGELMVERLRIPLRPKKFSVTAPCVISPFADLRHLVTRLRNCKMSVKIGLVGKYTGLPDTYLSVIKALEHAAVEAEVKLDILWIESANLEESSRCDEAGEQTFQQAWETLRKADAVVCPGGFGDRGIFGKALSSHHCRVNKKPYLGICLGMQTAVIDFARDVLKLEGANSEEFDATTNYPVVISMPEHVDGPKGGSMRLGKRTTYLKPTCLTYKLYNQQLHIEERHRHRYEVNPKYIPLFEENGLQFVGHDINEERMEVAELDNHPYFVCVQYHPEFLSRPLRPSPVFLGLVLAAIGKLEKRLEDNNQCLRSGYVYECEQFT